MPFVGIVVARDIARKFGTLQLELILLDHMLLNQIATSLIDRMRHVGVKFIRSIVIGMAIVANTLSAVIAVVATNMVLVSTATTAIGKLAAGHGHERAVATFNYLQITDHETMVKGDGAERA